MKFYILWINLILLIAMQCCAAQPLSRHSPVFIAGGLNGFLSVTTDEGKTWNNKSIPGLSADANFSKISCAGKGQHAVCVAIGDRTPSQLPFIVVSNDAANTWAIKDISQWPIRSHLEDVSCSGEGGNTSCAVVGFSNNSEVMAFILVSTDQGNTWEIKNVDIPKPSPYSFSGQFLHSVSCIENFCAAVGGVGADAIIVVSNDSGRTWQNKLPSGNNINELDSVSCIRKNNNVNCVAVGKWRHVVSVDNGNSWNMSANFYRGMFDSVSCAGNGADSYCLASGAFNSGSLAFSNDINYWADLKASTIYRNTSCASGGINTTCVSVGDSSMKVIYDSGKRWADYNELRGLYHVNCAAGSNDSVNCIAAGRTVFISTDSGQTWKSQFSQLVDAVAVTASEN